MSRRSESRLHIPPAHRYLVRFQPRRISHLFTDVLIVGSGFSYHNLRMFGDPRATPVSERFDEWLRSAVETPDPGERDPGRRDGRQEREEERHDGRPTHGNLEVGRRPAPRRPGAWPGTRWPPGSFRGATFISGEMVGARRFERPTS